MTNKRILTLMIPTFNRAEIVAENLKGIIKMLRQNHLLETIELVVSNNASSDHTSQVLSTIVQANPDVCILLFNHEHSLGSTGNMNFVLGKSRCNHVMYIGDDDYISQDYLNAVLHYIKTVKDLSCVISSYKNIDLEGNPTGRGRDLNKKTKLYKKGFRSSLANTWRGHQLSGLVFRRSVIQGLLEKYAVTNDYPFIFFALACTHHGTTVLLPEYPVLVTRPPQKEKSWGYGDDGLIGDVFENYQKYRSYNIFQRSLLQLKLLDVQYWRYAMYLKRGIFPFMKCLWKIESGNTTLLPTRIVFPFFLPIIFFKKVISLLFTGELMSTLRTDVDI